MWPLNFLDSRKCFIALAIIVVISSVHCQNQASVDPQHVERNEGQSAEILCSFGRQVERCRFIMPSGETFRLPDGGSRGKYQYFGNGFTSGQCGINITNLDKNDEGTWRCSLDVGEDLEDIIGVFNVTITRSPQRLELFVTDANILREGIDLQAECTFNDGIPSATIDWFLGDERVQPRDPIYKEDDRTGVSFVSSTFQRMLRANDNLKSLVCRVNHPALQDGFMNTTHQLHVNFPPQALSRQELYISGLTIGSSANIEVFIRSNPIPMLQWTIDGRTMKEDTQDERFVVQKAVQTEDGRYSAKLTVIQLSLQDTTKVYNLRASNEWGSQDYQIRIGGSPDENASGLGIVAIIAIVIAALVVLVIVALLVVARITKRWCFAGASMHPNSPDSEAQIAPDEDKTHEQYEQMDGKVSDEESSNAPEPIKATNGKPNGNTSV